MIHIIKNNKWVIATSLFSVFFGLLTFFTFINQSFIKLNDLNLQILLIIDALFLILFFTLIVRAVYKILADTRKKTLGSETSLRYIVFFNNDIIAFNFNSLIFACLI